MSKKARKYTAQEKCKVAFAALKGELTYAQISSEYGVHTTQINRWKKQLKEGMANVFRDEKASVDTGHEELTAKLYQQIGELTVERDWLKKKSAKLFD